MKRFAPAAYEVEAGSRPRVHWPQTWACPGGVIVEAYAQLVAEGYLVTGPRSGTRVSERIEVLPTRRLASSARAPVPVRYELRSGAPDPASCPRGLAIRDG